MRKFNLLDEIWSRVCLNTLLGKNYSTDKNINQILDYIMNYKEEVKIISSVYEIIVTSDDFEFNGWNNNKWFAWLHEGSFRKDDEVYSWKKQMPSCPVMLDFREWLIEKNTKNMGLDGKMYTNMKLMNLEG